MYLSYNGAARLTFGQSIIFINSGPLFICFMIIYDINKDLNIFFPFPDQATPLTLENNLGTILGSKPEKIKNIESRKKLGVLKKCLYWV